MDYGTGIYHIGDDTEYKGFIGYSKKEYNNLMYLHWSNKGLGRRKAGIYRNGKLIAHIDTIKRVVSFNYSRIADDDVLEFVSRADNSISPCVKSEFITKAINRLKATLDYHKKVAINKRKANKRYSTKRVHCPNCGKWFRVPRKSKQKYCSKACAKEFDTYLNNMHRGQYIKRLKDKINYDVSKEYMPWQDDRKLDSAGRSINLGLFKTNEINTRKRANESWMDYHKRLEKLKP